MNEGEKKTLFVDGTIRVRMVAGVVRLEFGEVGETEGDEKPPKMVPKLRLAMPLDGFLRTFEVFKNVIDKMEKDGLISKKDDAGKAKAKEK